MCGMCQDQTEGDLVGFIPVQHLKGNFWKVFAMVAGAHTSSGPLLLL